VERVWKGGRRDGGKAPLVISLLVNNVGWWAGGWQGGGRGGRKFTRLSRCVNRKSKIYLLLSEREFGILQGFMCCCSAIRFRTKRATHDDVQAV